MVGGFSSVHFFMRYSLEQYVGLITISIYLVSKQFIQSILNLTISVIVCLQSIQAASLDGENRILHIAEHLYNHHPSHIPWSLSKILHQGVLISLKAPIIVQRSHNTRDQHFIHPGKSSYWSTIGHASTTFTYPIFFSRKYRVSCARASADIPSNVCRHSSSIIIHIRYSLKLSRWPCVSTYASK